MHCHIMVDVQRFAVKSLRNALSWKDKMEHTHKRLRAERNIYISAGCLFGFFVLCQLW